MKGWEIQVAIKPKNSAKKVVVECVLHILLEYIEKQS